MMRATSKEASFVSRSISKQSPWAVWQSHLVPNARERTLARLYDYAFVWCPPHAFPQPSDDEYTLDIYAFTVGAMKALMARIGSPSCDRSNSVALTFERSSSSTCIDTLAPNTKPPTEQPRRHPPKR